MRGRHGLALWARLALALVFWLPTEAVAQGTPGAAVPPGLAGRIAYSNAHGIWVMNAEGSDRRRVTQPGTEHADYDPALSPDGSTIAFRSSRATPEDSTMLVDVDGTNERSLAVLAGLPAPYGMAQQGWSPDGTTLVFTCNAPRTPAASAGSTRRTWTARS